MRAKRLFLSLRSSCRKGASISFKYKGRRVPLDEYKAVGSLLEYKPVKKPSITAKKLAEKVKDSSKAFEKRVPLISPSQLGLSSVRRRITSSAGKPSSRKPSKMKLSPSKPPLRRADLSPVRLRVFHLIFRRAELFRPVQRGLRRAEHHRVIPVELRVRSRVTRLLFRRAEQLRKLLGVFFCLRI